MNAIPFVVIFIAVISLSWSSLMQTTLSSKRSCQGYISHLAALNNARTKIEKGFFAAAKKPEEKDTPKAKRSEKTYQSPRIDTRKESSKLFLSNKSDSFTIDAFEKLIEILYSDAPFFQKKMTKRISDELFPLLSEEFELTAVVFKDEEMQEVWYRILKGDGCPSLSRYISFQENEQLIYSRYASFPVVTALLGEDIANEILESEEAKYYDQEDKQSLLSEEELSRILSNHNQSIMKKHLNFSSSPKVPKIIEGRDQDIVLEIKTSSAASNSTEQDVVEDPVPTDDEIGL